MTAPVHPEVRIGHVHLTVSNLERALKFYRDALGFEVTQRYGTSAAFLSAGGYHHHIGLTPGRGKARPSLRPGAPAFIISRFFTLTGENSRARSSGFLTTA